PRTEVRGLSTTAASPLILRRPGAGRQVVSRPKRPGEPVGSALVIRATVRACYTGADAGAARYRSLQGMCRPERPQRRPRPTRPVLGAERRARWTGEAAVRFGTAPSQECGESHEHADDRGLG